MKGELIMKIGDTVTRWLCGSIPMKLKITDLTQNKIICGNWEFDRETGVEIDNMIDVPISHIEVGE